ncbi:DNA adenine methylase [Mangrovimonas sp. CR14]|uniref:DNA adenine methylase n=1 Tax=Mangrovimonas sp. CR14 TaxID=2706120 RepID=UPI0014206742|nr:DNA adenine methylase [Mangrovimonas sp. CR14]NIK91834.1 DNA adenine methylase [Mangrovimonas sp. CR14]
MKTAKPFLKWAGGKSQLISEIENSLPQDFNKKEFTFIEPFVGSGAVMFWMLNKYPNIKKAVINDINTDLTNTYITIKKNVEAVIQQLNEWQSQYHQFKNDVDERKEYYYEKRALFNTRESDSVVQASLFIFLNRTCFNGLYRVNKSNEFNVPIGSYKTPLICDKENLMEVSKLLEKVEISNGDFEDTLFYAEKDTFFYFDPPYKPLSNTSSFNSYAKDEFNDHEQIRLRDFCKKLNAKGHFWMLSNSDVKGKNPDDNFFDDLYSNFNINRVQARRNINANPKKRGKLNELLITNYTTEVDYAKAI